MKKRIALALAALSVVGATAGIAQAADDAPADTPIPVDLGGGIGDTPIPVDLGGGIGDTPIPVDLGGGIGDTPIPVDLGGGIGDTPAQSAPAS